MSPSSSLLFAPLPTACSGFYECCRQFREAPTGAPIPALEPAAAVHRPRRHCMRAGHPV